LVYHRFFTFISVPSPKEWKWHHSIMIFLRNILLLPLSEQEALVVCSLQLEIQGIFPRVEVWAPKMVRRENVHYKSLGVVRSGHHTLELLQRYSAPLALLTNLQLAWHRCKCTWY
jgi:hypothetical protein